MFRFMVVLGLSLSLAGTPVHAQTITCPEHPRYTVETFKERLLELAATGRVNSVRGLMGSAMTPRGVPPSCHLLPQDEDLDEVLDELIRFVALQDDPDLHREFFGGVRTSIIPASDRSHREIPLNALIFAIEEGRSGQARGVALSTLERLADDPRVFALLLEWARAETGPPRFPNRPQVIAGSVYVMEAMRNAEAFRAALEADLSLIRNPRVRCLAERNMLPPEVRRQGPPDCPPRE